MNAGLDRVSPARRAAHEVLRRVFEHDAWADRALPAALERYSVPAAERGQAQRLAYGAVQRRGTSDALIERLSDRSLEQVDAGLLAAMRLGFYELLFADATPDYAAVDQAVELAKASTRKRRGEGFVNALLRRSIREREQLLESLDDRDPAGAAVAHSHPLWLVEQWWEELGPEVARALLAAGNRPGETAIRVNTMRSPVDRVIAALKDGGASVESAAGPAPLDVPGSYVIDGPIGSGFGALLDRGDAVAQSRASAAVVAILDPQPGERLLDLCAGPGIKTTQMAERLQGRGEIVAVELDAGRASQLRELAERHGAETVRVVKGDAATGQWMASGGNDLGDGYDRVLVDPPCSDLGTLASRPDARWRKSPELIERLLPIQRAVLRRGAEALRPGGTLVYSTCTISARENQAQVESLLAESGGDLRADPLGERFPAVALDADPRFLQTRPDRDRTDGFFIARLVKAVDQ